MDHKNNNRYNAFMRISDFLKEHNDQLITMPLYAPLKNAFDTEMQNIRIARQTGAKQTDAITKTKKIRRLTMAETMLKYLKRASVQANQIENISLERSLSKPITYFTCGREHDAAAKATVLMQLIQTNHGILTIITDDDIAEMSDAINNFLTLIPLPKQQIKQKKAISTDVIPGILNKLDTIRDNITKLIHSYLPEIAHTWDELIKIGNYQGIRHLSLEIKVVDSATNVSMRGVKCTIRKGADNLVKFSSRRGWIRYKSLGSANWSLSIEYNNYQPEHLENIATSENKITRLHIPLIKVNPASI